MTCSKCNRNFNIPTDPCACRKPCDPCKRCCDKPILDIDEMPDSVSTLRFNVNGLSSWYDFGNMIYQTQTDTTLSIDTVNRALNYAAERHTDTISHEELGSILHIADIGDVDISGVTDNSLFVYQKNSDCGTGCEGIDNSWIAWNALDGNNLQDRLTYLMGFDDDAKPRTLNTPADTTQYWTLTWDAANKAGWSQPVEVATPPTITEDNQTYVFRLYLDPTTKQIVVCKEAVQ